MLRLQRPLPDRYSKASDAELADWITAAKAELGDRLFILGHHYQRDDVIAFADARGDSFKLSVLAQQRPEAEFIVFCGVHFMAESADILTSDDQAVILPDLNAGCSMADMADLDQVEEAWEVLGETVDISRVVPITYMNSSAAIKSFVGKHGGAVCTSSNAQAVLEWALGTPDAQGVRQGGQGDKVLFFPDQHLGRNTGLAMGYDHTDMRLWNPRLDRGGLTEADCKEATLLLWKGHCTIHQRFSPEQVADFRAQYPDGVVIIHPEAPYEACEKADFLGSTGYILKKVAELPAGTAIGVGTEVHLVSRLAQEHPDKTIVNLDPLICPCSTMSRIDLPHLAWVLEELLEGRVINQISVDADTTEWSKVALERMLAIT
ncbi:MAG: quinolinate synthase NadA [Acidimicrobiales bacterium]